MMTGLTLLDSRQSIHTTWLRPASCWPPRPNRDVIAISLAGGIAALCCVAIYFYLVLFMLSLWLAIAHIAGVVYNKIGGGHGGLVPDIGCPYLS